VFAYERGLGWSFAAWKLYSDDGSGVIDAPEKLLSLKDVAEAGLFPDLTEPIPAKVACLNPPDADFALGDDTLAPTMGPPPDCGNGWWNYTSSQCDYWIPPPPPTPAPTVPCPECEECLVGSNGIAKAAVGSSAVTLLLVFVFMKIFGKNKREDYREIPH